MHCAASSILNNIYKTQLHITHFRNMSSKSSPQSSVLLLNDDRNIFRGLAKSHRFMHYSDQF